MGEKLGIGAAFPALSLTLLDQGLAKLPACMPGAWKVVLFYRGHW
ncbi:MAG: hypothetical protein OXF26_05890 [Alphaproteobacteria bacterium]|nr:hypothetical protein [Alphaproteobacteria bacterium]MCY4320334.1 hypothetical protein [Alphaproteobacteria bacterium]